MKTTKRILSILLSLIIALASFGSISSVVFADYDDGMECPICGKYRWDDWLACDDCGMCIDCADDYTCPYCGECTYCIGEWCEGCGSCPDCGEIICSDCGGACFNCSDDSLFCIGCERCGNCNGETVCPGCCETCGECEARDQCGECFYCEDCGEMICTECGKACFHCSDDSLFCIGCGRCGECNGETVCPGCCETCGECEARDQCGECFYCEDCGEMICTECGKACFNCSDDSMFCLGCGRCGDCNGETVCPGCCETCGECEARDQCGNCFYCEDCGEIICSECGTACFNCSDDSLFCIGCGRCGDCNGETACPGCGETCGECEAKDQCGECFYCEDCGEIICSECGKACFNCSDDSLFCIGCGRCGDCNGETACPGCGETCGECEAKEQCGECFYCEDCGEIICSECGKACFNCSDDSLFCIGCGRCGDCNGETACPGCGETCGECEAKEQCGECLYCEDCGEMICTECGKACFNCSDDSLFCIGCGRCGDCNGGTVCPGCCETCGECEAKEQCGNCLYCEDCGEIICSECGNACFNCSDGDEFCEGCGRCGDCNGNSSCPSCHGTCGECEAIEQCGNCLYCEDCGEIICSECGNACFNCSDGDEFCSGCGRCGDCNGGTACPDCHETCGECEAKEQCGNCLFCEDCGEIICSECGNACFNCSDGDEFCSGCGRCGDCNGGTACPDCHETCAECEAKEQCGNCLFCEDCAGQICTECGDACCNCMDEYEFCSGCGRCGDCNGYTFCPDCHETCAECESKEQCGNCFYCEDCSFGTICPSCGMTCENCMNIEQCTTCYTCADCADICINCGDFCSECDPDFNEIFCLCSNCDDSDAEVSAVIEMIDNIGPVQYTPECKEKIDAATAAYNALSTAQKRLVTNIETLRNAGRTYNRLKAIDDQRKADIVTALINDLPEEVQMSDKGAVDAARAAYDALTDDQKALIDADVLAKLVAAEDIVSPEPLINTSYVESDVVSAGGNVKIIGSAEGGRPAYTYEYFYRKSGSKVWNTAANGITPKLRTTGCYEIRVVVTDKNGTTAEKIINVTVGESLTNNSTAPDVKAGAQAVINGSASGGTGGYTYTYYYKRSTSKNYMLIGTENTAATSVSFKTSTACTYDIKVIVTDSSGAKAEKLMTLNVTVEELRNNSTAPDVNAGAQAVINGSASGGSGGYTYTYYYKRSTSKNYMLIGAENTTVTSVSFKTSTACTYDIKVIVTDSSGAKAEKLMTLNVTVEELKNNSTAPDVKAGAQAVINGSASGGSGGYTYTYYYKRSTSKNYMLIGAENTTATSVSFKTSTACVYDIKVIVTDSSGAKAEKILTLNVSAADELKNNSTAPDVKAGAQAVINGSASGGAGGYTYTYYYKRSTSKNYMLIGAENTAATSVSFKTSTPCTYDIKVIVTDSKGAKAEKLMTLNVSAAGELKNNSTVSATNITPGTKVYINTAAEGGTDAYTWSVRYRRQGAMTWTEITLSDGTASFAPKNTATYEIIAEVTDSSGASVKNTFTVKVSG